MNINSIENFEKIWIQENLEAIIGTNEMLDISFLKRALRVSKTVCRINVNITATNQKKGHATGFLIAPGLIITNNHVFSSKKEAKNQLAEFNFEKDENESQIESVFFRIKPQNFFITNKNLDYTIVALDNLSSSHPSVNISKFGHNFLTKSHLGYQTNERLNIIQHPRGDIKKIAIRSNEVFNTHGNFVDYSTDTMPGSSGSPVSNDNWEIIALHKCSLNFLDKDGRKISVDKGTWHPSEGNDKILKIANRGVRIETILKDVLKRKKQLPMNQQRRLIDFSNNFQHEEEIFEIYSLPTH